MSKKSTKKSSDHPTYAVMISSAISTLKDRTGSSRQAITKFVCANYKVDADKAAPHLLRALKKGVQDGVFKMARQSGKGAGSYKLVVKKKPTAKKAKSSTKSEAVAGKKTKPSNNKSGAAKKSEAGKKSKVGLKSVTKKPKVGKKSEKASKKA